jgi:hypothetical protein
MTRHEAAAATRRQLQSGGRPTCAIKGKSDDAEGYVKLTYASGDSYTLRAAASRQRPFMTVRPAALGGCRSLEAGPKKEEGSFETKDFLETCKRIQRPVDVGVF